MCGHSPAKHSEPFQPNQRRSRLFKRLLFWFAALVTALSIIVVVSLYLEMQSEERVRRDVVAYGGTAARKRVEPEWLEELASSSGLYQLCPIVTILLRSPGQIPDRVFEEIGSLGNLQSLVLGGTSCDNDALRSLIGSSENNSSRLESLKMLMLDDSRVTNDGLPFLKALSSLERLSLKNTAIDDNGMRFIAELDSLQSLRLCSTQVSGSGLECIANGNFRLRELYLSNTSLKSVDCHAIAQIHRLVVLDLDNTRVDNSCLLLLKDLKHLSVLRIRNTRVTDGGLNSLQEMESLRFLDLVGSDVTLEGALRLKRDKPNLTIDLLQ